MPCPPVWTSRVRSEGLWKTTPAQRAPIGTVPDKQAQMAASGVGPKARFLTIFFFFQKNRDASDRNLDLENGWRQRREVVGTVKRLMPGLLEGISDFM